jgi:branched-chain amino acid transport system ATP-binding protein
MTEAVLAVRNLSKTFGALKATDDVSLDLRAGRSMR